MLNFSQTQKGTIFFIIETKYHLHPKYNIEIRLSIYNKITLNKPIKIATSRSHSNTKMEKFLSQFDSVSLHPMGSSLKMCLVADGTIDCYPRLGPTMEWDTAAAHAIANGSNVKLFNTSFKKEISYNKKNLLNPFFIACS